MRQSTKTVLHISGCVLIIVLCVFGDQMNNPNDELPRNAKLPTFNPYDPNFTCQVEATKLPEVDAQADAWFREARALEDPRIYPEDREDARILQLTRMAADRRHWKAMLNLASMYAEGLDPKRGVDDAVLLVEDVMRMGVPAAYDRMGTFYANGTGVPGSSDKGYAFWQHAARIGSPLSLSYLGVEFNTGIEYGTRWSNIPVATQMLECAFSQGDASATLELSYIYRAQDTPLARHVGGAATSTAKELAFRILHEGVRLGCKDCARDMSVDFSHPLGIEDMLAPYIDPSRGERYGVLNDALSFNPFRRLPNLDKILPLPPAILPPWDSTRDSLLEAAMGVTFSPDLPPAAPRPPGNRQFVDPAYRLRKTAETTAARNAPFGGYWQPLVNGLPLKDTLPGLYEKDEQFPTIFVPKEHGEKSGNGVTWAYHITIRNSEHEVDPVAVPGLTRKVPRPTKLVTSRSNEVCKVGGIWQPWIPTTHRLQDTVNQPWRQVFLLKGQSFPQPKRDWLLDLDENEVTWHLMEESGPGMVPKKGGAK